MIKLTKRAKKLKRQYRRKHIYHPSTPMQKLALATFQIISSKLLACEGMSIMANSILKELKVLKELKEIHQQNLLEDEQNEPVTVSEFFKSKNK